MVPPGRTSNLHAERDTACGATHSPLCARKYPDHPRPRAKVWAMIHPQPGLRLPLMDHLVEHRVLDFQPRMPEEMAPADRDLDRSLGPEIHAQLAQAGSHSPRDPQR